MMNDEYLVDEFVNLFGLILGSKDIEWLKRTYTEGYVGNSIHGVTEPGSR